MIDTSSAPGGSRIDGPRPAPSPHRHGGSARYPASTYLGGWVVGWVTEVTEVTGYSLFCRRFVKPSGGRCRCRSSR